jgi:hypothetical protein
MASDLRDARRRDGELMSDDPDEKDDGRFWRDTAIVRVGLPTPKMGSPEHEAYLADLRAQFAACEVPRPTKFKPEFVQQAFKLYREGWIDDQVADFFGVSDQTILNWREKHKDFAEARKRGKDIADDRVEQALYRRAMGYDYKAEKIGFSKDGDVRRAETVEHMPADPKAAMNWLKNRRSEHWKDRRELTGADGAPLHPAGEPSRSKIEIARRMLYIMQRAADENGGQLTAVPQIIEEKVTIHE